MLQNVTTGVFTSLPRPQFDPRISLFGCAIKQFANVAALDVMFVTRLNSDGASGISRITYAAAETGFDDSQFGGRPGQR